MTTAENINELLKSKDWSGAQLYAQLADHGVNVSPYTVDGWVKGIRSPRTSHVIELAKVFGCTTDAILRGPEFKAAS